MALSHRSIATIDSPEFINLQPLDINPLMSSCEIKVFYLGKNRNRSYISKQVATDMAKTLRGAPIVGYFREDKGDFGDHGEQIIMDADGIHFNCLTKPYGFVSPDAKVWFQKFKQQDQFGNEVQRQYLMTTGYLWTGQFEEAKKVVQEGQPHSMELEEETLQGHWTTDNNLNLEFFIISDAIFSKLCILGDDVEPCFEGSSVTEPNVSVSFSKTIDNNFKNTLFSMLKDLEYVLKGGSQVDNNEELKNPVSEQAGTQFSQEQVQEPSELEGNQTEFKENKTTDKNEKEAPVEHAKEDEKEDKKEPQQENDNSKKQDQEDKEKEEKYSLLEQQYNDLKNQYSVLEQKYQQLVEFKETVENQKKDQLIAEFYMLSEEDKKDVIENKSKYTIDEIKAKLAVICYDKKVNFSLEDSNKNETKIEDNTSKTTVTFNFNENTDEPAWIKAVEANQKDI